MQKIQTLCFQISTCADDEIVSLGCKAIESIVKVLDVGQPNDPLEQFVSVMLRDVRHDLVSPYPVSATNFTPFTMSGPESLPVKQSGMTRSAKLLAAAAKASCK